MASIQVELNTIKNDPDGQDVLNAIASASEKINQNEFDIAQELAIIRNPVNRYGIDIRMAIHDALEKLSEKEGGGGDGSGFFCSSNVIAVSKGLILPMDIVSAELPPRPPAPFTCNDGYLLSTAATWTINNVTYTKATDEYAVGIIIDILASGVQEWTAPVLLSPVSETAIQYTVDGVSGTWGRATEDGNGGAITYQGSTWYYSIGYGQGSGSYTTSSGLPKCNTQGVYYPFQSSTIVEYLLGPLEANVQMTS